MRTFAHMADCSEERDESISDGVRFQVSLPDGRQVEVGYREDVSPRRGGRNPLVCPACSSPLAQPAWESSRRYAGMLRLPLRCPECDGVREVSLNDEEARMLRETHRRGLSQIAADLRLIAEVNEREARAEIEALADALANGEIDPSRFDP